MIKLKACNICKTDQAKVFYNIEDRSFDTYPILNTDIGLVVAYINICFDSETMNARQVWGFSPKASWKERTLAIPAYREAGLRLSTELEPGDIRLDWDRPWNTYYDNEKSWLCLGDPETDIRDEALCFLKNAVAVLNGEKELKSLWLHVLP